MSELIEGAVVAVPPDGEGVLSPDARVAGLSLTLRAMLTLQARGAHRLHVAVLPDMRDHVEALAVDPRVTAEVDVVEVEPGASPVDALAAAAGSLEPLRYDVIAVGDVEIDVQQDGGRRRATRALFDACRKPVDGVVSRHFNRHVSLFISRMLVDTPITPNMMTGVTFAVSVLAAAFALDGSYRTTLLAAVLMQLNSILDGCDGELARVRHQGSTLGQWLDTIGDDASNVLFWAALGFGARSVAGYGDWLALAGWLAAGANALAALQNYALLARKGTGDWYALAQGDAEPDGVVGAVVRFFNLILRQDFFLFLCMCVAFAGYLHHMLPLVALGAVITLGAATARTFRARGAARGSAKQ